MSLTPVVGRSRTMARSIAQTLILMAMGIPAAAQPTTEGPPRQGDPLERFDLTEPAAIVRLPGRLREVSGLATAEGRVFAHDDERAVVYELDVADGELIKGFAMGDAVARDDFEGIEIVRDRVYLVSSLGRLYESREGADDERMLFNTYGTGVGRQCEVEGLAHEPADDTLLLLCKTPRVDALSEFVTVFRWSIESRELRDPPLRIPLADVERATGQRNFSASGIARDPLTGSYLLIAARDRAIASVSPDGRVLSGGRLDADRHPQAEGVAFSREGHLLIADEGRDSRARITAYGAPP